MHPSHAPHLLVHRLPHRPATRRCPNPAAPGRQSGELLPSRSGTHPSGRRTPTSSSRHAAAIVTRGRPTCCFCCCSPPTQRRRCRRRLAFTKLLVDPGSTARRVERSLASFGWRYSPKATVMARMADGDSRTTTWSTRKDAGYWNDYGDC